MKEKIIVGIISIIVLIGAIFTAIMINNNEKEDEVQENIKVSQEKVTDECTEQYKISKQQNGIQEVNSNEDKISSNSLLILKKYYEECGHTINEYVEMLPELVNMTEDEIEQKFIEWELIDFSNKEVTLFKEFEGTCGEHFRIKEENGKVIIYKVLSDETEQIYEKTEITTEFLPETDLLKMQTEKGIEVFGKEELNKILEDFE